MGRGINFPFERRPSHIFGAVFRPVATVGLWSRMTRSWVDVVMLIDTGSDYTLLPSFYAENLGVNFRRDGRLYETMGIGGFERVHLIRRWRMRIGSWQRTIPLGFLARPDIPPLLGRQGCLETFKMTLARHVTTITRP